MRVERQPRQGGEMRSKGVAEMIGASYSKVNRWVTSGLIGGDAVRPGSGSQVVLDDRELEEAWVLARLAELGVTKVVMAQALDDHRSQVAKDGPPRDGDVLIVFPPEGAAMRLRRSDVLPVDAAWVVPLRTAEDIAEGDQEWNIVFGSPDGDG